MEAVAVCSAMGRPREFDHCVSGVSKPRSNARLKLEDAVRIRQELRGWVELTTAFAPH